MPKGNDSQPHCLNVILAFDSRDLFFKAGGGARGGGQPSPSAGWCPCLVVKGDPLTVCSWAQDSHGNGPAAQRSRASPQAGPSPPPPLSGPSSPGALPCQCPDVLFQKTKSPFTKEASECLLTFPFLNPSNAGEILVLVKDVLAHKSNAVSGGSADLQ